MLYFNVTDENNVTEKAILSLREYFFLGGDAPFPKDNRYQATFICLEDGLPYSASYSGNEKPTLNKLRKIMSSYGYTIEPIDLILQDSPKPSLDNELETNNLNRLDKFDELIN